MSAVRRIDQALAQAVVDALREALERGVHRKLSEEDLRHWFSYTIEKRLERLGVSGEGIKVETLGVALTPPYIVHGIVTIQDYILNPPRSAYYFMLTHINKQVIVKVARLIRNNVYVHTQTI